MIKLNKNINFYSFFALLLIILCCHLTIKDTLFARLYANVLRIKLDRIMRPYYNCVFKFSDIHFLIISILSHIAN